MKQLANFLIVAGIVIYTVCLLTFVEMETNYKTAFLIGESLICFGILIFSINREEK